MNVALVILHADPAKGGAETYTVDLARALADRGHAVSVLAASFADAVDPRVGRVSLPYAGATRVGRYASFLAGLDAHLAAVGMRLGATAAGGRGVATRAGGYDVVHAMLPVRRCDLYHPHAGIAAEAVAGGHLKHASPVRRAGARLANQLNRKRQRFAAVERELLTAGGDGAAGTPPLVICLSDYIKATVRRHYPL
ncbi:MAG: glycosyl transferase, group 1, partial [Phycisphaerales bacterium]|nr:glycosyl transferase, group 1 [Phycisphaerales bacterium]